MTEDVTEDVVEEKQRAKVRQPNTQQPSTQKRRRDETLICDRCGVTFLWTIEEQRRQGTEPSYCAGCRVLLPSTGRTRGMIKWYDPRKNYGFIGRVDAEDLFLHRSQIEEGQRLQEGDLVEFSVVESEKGPMAAEVRLLHREGTS